MERAMDAEKNTDAKKTVKVRKKKRLLLPVVSMLFFVLLIIVLSIGSSYHAVIEHHDDGYFRARAVIIAGNFLFCLRDAKNHKNQKSIDMKEKGSYTPAFYSIGSVKSIEITMSGRDSEDDTSEYGGALSLYQCLGTYRVNVSGHQGILYLAYKDRRPYGTIRFPEWASGVSEPLKMLRIGNGSISFVRSVSTAKEMKRVGVTMYFTQTYSGRYSPDGRTIRGSYEGGKGESLWEARRLKK